MATQREFHLVYGEHALVYIKPRSLCKFFSKMWRFGKARPQRWREDGIKINIFKIFLNSFRPPSYGHIADIITERGKVYMKKYQFWLWLYHYIVKIIQGIGSVYSEVRFIIG